MIIFFCILNGLSVVLIVRLILYSCKIKDLNNFSTKNTTVISVYWYFLCTTSHGNVVEEFSIGDCFIFKYIYLATFLNIFFSTRITNTSTPLMIYYNTPRRIFYNWLPV